MNTTETDLYILAWQRVQQLTNKELLVFVRSKNSIVRNLIVQQFHMRPSREVFEIALSLTQDKAALAREAGYLILGRLGTPERLFRAESSDLLMHGLEVEHAVSVQCAIAYGIGHLSPPRVLHAKIIKRFHKLLNRKRRSLFVAIAFAISGLSMSPSLEKLAQRLQNYKDKEVTDWLEISLEEIKGN